MLTEDEWRFMLEYARERKAAGESLGQVYRGLRELLPTSTRVRLKDYVDVAASAGYSVIEGQRP